MPNHGLHAFTLASGIIGVRHRTVPSPASRDTTLPRNVQHDCSMTPVKFHSLDDTPTSTRPSWTTGFDVICEKICVSTCRFHTRPPSDRRIRIIHAPWKGLPGSVGPVEGPPRGLLDWLVVRPSTRSSPTTAGLVRDTAPPKAT
jgi:hypothetical protein